MIAINKRSDANSTISQAGLGTPRPENGVIPRVRSLVRIALVFAMPVALVAAPSDIAINEIQYNPPPTLGADADFEFVELLNSSSSEAVDLEGWILKDDDDTHRYEFPAGSQIQPGQAIVVARNPAAIAATYGAELTIFGPFDFALANGGDAVRVYDAAGHLIDWVEYDDDSPWPTAADGNGSSLERIDASAKFASDFVNFAASNNMETSGTPGRDNSQAGNLPSRAHVVINEIQYNPVTDPDADDLLHCASEDFVELHNRSDAAIDISGWRFERGIDFEFPAGTLLPAGDFVVVFSDRDGFESKYGSITDTTKGVGPFSGRLSDGGEVLLLVDAQQRPVDYVDFNDRDPWPINPDGSRGSLELADAFANNDRARSWEESTDFRGSPGRKNTATEVFELTGNSAPGITLAKARADGIESREGSDELSAMEIRAIASTDAVRVSARVTDPDRVGNVRLHYQTVAPGDYIRRTDPRYEAEWTEVEMSLDLELHRYAIVLPPLPNRTLVRYRVVATDTFGAESVAPRLGDPEPNYAFFVYDGVPDYVADIDSRLGDPGVVHADPTDLPVYHLIARAEDTEEAHYDATRDSNDNTYYWVGSFVFENRVYDHVPFRLRGNQRFLRKKRYWKIKFNKGNRFRGRYNDGTPYENPRRRLNLNSNEHVTNTDATGGVGLIETMGFRLFREAGVPSPRTTQVYLRMIDSAAEHTQYDGDFFGVYLDIQQIDNVMFEDQGRPSIDAGIYKMGGPVKRSPDCSPELDDYNAFVNGYSAIDTREWYEENVNLESYLSFRAVVQLVQHADLGGHNFYYYQNPETKQWELVPWDLDSTMIADRQLNISDPISRQVLPKFEREYHNRYRYLWQTLYNLDRLSGILEDERARLRKAANADRDRWDKETRLTCPLTTPREECLDRYNDFDNVVDLLADWFRRQSSLQSTVFLDLRGPAPARNLSPDANVDVTLPVELRSRPLLSPDGSTHVRSHWVVVKEGGDWVFPIWEIEIDSPLDRVTLPDEILSVGESYEFRVRHLDSAGRWSLLSEPTAFHVRTAVGPAPAAPRDFTVRSRSTRGHELVWSPPDAADAEVLGFHISRDGERIATLSRASDAFQRSLFVDEHALPEVAHTYGISTLTRGGESAEETAASEALPTPNYGGWLPPNEGFHYLYEASGNEADYVVTPLVLGALDGEWVRSSRSDRWDGSIPGEGAPGGVRIEQVSSTDGAGAAVSTLNIEDAGDPDLPLPDNGTIYLLRHLELDGLTNENRLLDEGATLVARWRVNPNPTDLEAPSGQQIVGGRGQITLVHDGGRTARRIFSLSLNGSELLFPGGTVPIADPQQFQSVWATIVAAEDGHRVRLYLNGAAEPTFDDVVTLPPRETETRYANYLAIGLGDSPNPGSVQIDFVGYRQGVHAPISDREPSTFRRGDVDANSVVEISDAITLLNYLFRGEREPQCIDAADANDSGSINVTDAITILLNLFRGTSLPEPRANCDEDPTADTISCLQSTCSL